jgi:hypothetical protein
MDTKKPKKEEPVEAVPVQGENWLQDLLQHMAAQESQGEQNPEGSSCPVSRETVERLIDKVTSRS